MKVRLYPSVISKHTAEYCNINSVCDHSRSFVTCMIPVSDGECDTNDGTIEIPVWLYCFNICFFIYFLYELSFISFTTLY